VILETKANVFKEVELNILSFKSDND